MVSAMEKRASSSPPVTPTLRAIPFTASGGAEALLLSSAQREQLAQIGVRIRLPARMVILREESPADWVFAISDGCVKCYRELPSGKRALSAFLFSHDIFGLAENGRYVNTVQAISNVTLFRVPTMELANLLKQDGNLQFQFLSKVTHELRSAQRRATMINRRDAVGRFAMFIALMGNRSPVLTDGQEVALADGALRHRRLPRPVARIREPLRRGARAQRPGEVREPAPRAHPRRRPHGQARGGRLAARREQSSDVRRMEALIHRLAGFAEHLTDAAAVIIVAYGVIEAFVHLLGIMARPRTSHGERKKVWRRFGVWLLLGLEFELAADIIGSIVSPTWEDIGQLGAIAVIRTFLNYFLEQDLDHADAAGEAREPIQS